MVAHASPDGNQPDELIAGMAGWREQFFRLTRR
jgi:hypothetical protein